MSFTEFPEKGRTEGLRGVVAWGQRASRLGLRRIVMISPGDSGVHWVGSQERKYDPLLWSNRGRRLRLLGLVRFPRQKEAIFSVILAVSSLLKINRSPFFATYWL